MKRIIILVLILISLLVGVYFLWTNSKQYEDTFANVEHTQFAVENAKEVLGRIFIADREGNQALFERDKNDNWIYTNKITGKSYPYSPIAFQTLLETIEQVRARNRVVKASVNSVLKGIGVIGVKVELYDKKNKKIRTYYVGGPADAGQATYAVMDGSEIPYVVYIPHFQGSIDTRFIAKERVLRDKAIVRIKSKDLELVQVEYLAPQQRPYSFQIHKKGKNDYHVKALYENPHIRITDSSRVKKDHVEIYLEKFKYIGAERQIYDSSFRDSIIQTTPFARISYQVTGEERQDFTIYPLLNPSFDRGDGRPGIRERIRRYFVDVSADRFYMAQDLVLRQALRPFDFFMTNLDDRRISSK